MDSRDISVPLGELGAQVAEYQLSRGLHFIAENPQSSELWELPTWLKLLQRSDVVSCIVHQCMAGLRDPENKLRVKKPTRFVASDEILVKNLRPLWCRGNHPHSQLEGTYKGQNKTHMARIWPWELATRIAAGVSAVVRKVQKEKLNSA